MEHPPRVLPDGGYRTFVVACGAQQFAPIMSFEVERKNPATAGGK
jgi:hypothetical protein